MSERMGKALKQVRFWGEMLELAKKSPDQAAVPYWQGLYDKGQAILAERSGGLS